MPRSIRIFRLATAIITLLLVGMLIKFADDSTPARVMAFGILILGGLQWLGLGALGKRFMHLDEDGN